MSLRWFAPRQLVAVRGAPGLLRWLPCTDFAHPTGCLRRRPRRNSKHTVRAFIYKSYDPKTRRVPWREMGAGHWGALHNTDVV